MTMTTILRSELTCPSCIVKIQKQLRQTDGVEKATVHFNTGRIEVEHDETRAGAGALIEAVRKAGYEARISPF